MINYFKFIKKMKELEENWLKFTKNKIIYFYLYIQYINRNSIII